LKGHMKVKLPQKSRMALARFFAFMAGREEEKQKRKVFVRYADRFNHTSEYDILKQSDLAFLLWTLDWIEKDSKKYKNKKLVKAMMLAKPALEERLNEG